MKDVRRFVCLLIVAFLVIGLAACGGEVSTTPTPTAQDPTQGDAPEPSDSDDEVVYERVSITYAGPQPREGFDYTAGDEYALMLSTKFNYDLEAKNVPWNDWHSMLSTWIMAQNMPDVINYNYTEGTHADASSFVEQGLIRRLPDDWKTRWPGIARAYETTSLGPTLEELYDGTYFIPRARFFYNLPGDPLANHWSLWFRADWTEAVGFEVKNHYSIPEVLEIARRIKEEDPGDLGSSLIPMCMSAGNATRFFLEANNTHWDTFYKGSDGNYAWGAAAEQTLEGLKYWYEAYTSGILDHEFYLLAHEEDQENFLNTAVAGFSYLGAQSTDRYRIDFNDNTGIDMSAFGMATLLGADGYYHQRDLINFWGAPAFSPDSDDAVVERWLDLMEYQVSEDGYVGTAMGIKGVDWERDANGDLISLVPEGVLLSGGPGEGKYPSLGHVLGSAILWDDLHFVNPNIDISFREESQALYQNRYDLSTPETFTKVDWDLWMHYTENMRRARGIDYSTDFSNMITTASSEENLVEIYNTYIESQMPIIQPALDELNN